MRPRRISLWAAAEMSDSLIWNMILLCYVSSRCIDPQRRMLALYVTSLIVFLVVSPTKIEGPTMQASVDQ